MNKQQEIQKNIFNSFEKSTLFPREGERRKFKDGWYIYVNGGWLKEKSQNKDAKSYYGFEIIERGIADPGNKFQHLHIVRDNIDTFIKKHLNLIEYVICTSKDPEKLNTQNHFVSQEYIWYPQDGFARKKRINEKVQPFYPENYKINRIQLNMNKVKELEIDLKIMNNIEKEMLKEQAVDFKFDKKKNEIELELLNNSTIYYDIDNKTGNIFKKE
jgi:hypothetical protein